MKKIKQQKAILLDAAIINLQSHTTPVSDYQNISNDAKRKRDEKIHKYCVEYLHAFMKYYE